MAPALGGPFGSYVPAGFGQRLGARVIDSLVGVGQVILLYVALLIAIVVFGSPGGALVGLIVGPLIISLGSGIAFFTYLQVCETRGGRTLGRAATGIRVISLRPEAGPPARLTGGQAFVRRLVEGLGELLFGLAALTMLSDPHRRTWGDKASGTAVIQDRAPQPGTKKGVKVSSYATAITAAAVVALVGVTSLSGIGKGSQSSGCCYGEAAGTTGGSTDTSGSTSPTYSGSTDGGSAGQEPTTAPTSDAVPTVTGSVATGHFVHERPTTDPTSGGEDRVLPSGTAVTIVCQTTGAVVDNDNVWYRLADGYYVVAQFISVDTAPASC